MSDEITVRKLGKYNPSMDVPGLGEVEIPYGMNDMGGLGASREGRNMRNARHFANVMDPFGGPGRDVDFQYQKKPYAGRGKGV